MKKWHVTLQYQSYVELIGNKKNKLWKQDSFKTARFWDIVVFMCFGHILPLQIFKPGMDPGGDYAAHQMNRCAFGYILS